MDKDEEEEETCEYRSSSAVLLNCMAGNLETREGPHATSIVVGIGSTIQPMHFSLRDTRKLVVELLSVLHTNYDDFATKLVQDNFPFDAENRPYWPEESDKRS